MAGSVAPLLSVALIVRDEAGLLDSCLRSVRGWADEIVVVDTGSSDDSPAVAVSAGAQVRFWPWTDDFAAARNQALSVCTGRWVLSLDADEVVSGSPSETRRWLAEQPADVDAASVLITERSGPDRRGLAGHRELKLFRRDRARWAGRVHERLVRTRPVGTSLSYEEIPDVLLALTHSGYSSPDAVRRKSIRNADLSELELAEVLADPQRRADEARIRVDLGRGLIGAGERQRALDHFERVVTTETGTPEALLASDFLCRAAMGEGRLDEAGRWLDRLRQEGAPEGHCDFLQAQLLAELGSFGAALAVLDRITDLRDAGGHPLDPGVVGRLRAMIEEAQR